MSALSSRVFVGAPWFEWSVSRQACVAHLLAVVGPTYAEVAEMRGVADRFGRFVVPLPSRPEYVDLRFIRSAEPLVALLAYL